MSVVATSEQRRERGKGGGIRGYDQASFELCILVLIFALGRDLLSSLALKNSHDQH